MILDLNFINGDTKRNVPCLMVEYHDGVILNTSLKARSVTLLLSSEG